MEALVFGIGGVWSWSRGPQFRSRAVSPPGVTVHLLRKGSYDLVLNGLPWKVKSGDLVFYGGLEGHTWRGDGSETCFVSVNFHPGSWRLPPDNFRLVSSAGSARTQMERWFDEIEATFREDSPRSQARCFAALYQVLAQVAEVGAGSVNPHREALSGGSVLWRQVEALVVAKRRFRAKVAELAAWSGYDESTVYRACQSVHGQAPLVRLRAMRLEEARALLRHSFLPIGAVATELGFLRINEFCREFRLHVGVSPSQYRANLSR